MVPAVAMRRIQLGNDAFLLSTVSWTGREKESLGTRNKKKAQNDYEDKLEQIKKGTYEKSVETEVTLATAPSQVIVY
jgi:hypothetical protein